MREERVHTAAERRPEYDRTRARHGCPACDIVKTAAVANYAGEWETVA